MSTTQQTQSPRRCIETPTAYDSELENSETIRLEVEWMHERATGFAMKLSRFLDTGDEVHLKKACAALLMALDIAEDANDSIDIDDKWVIDGPSVDRDAHHVVRCSSPVELEIEHLDQRAADAIQHQLAHICRHRDTDDLHTELEYLADMLATVTEDGQRSIVRIAKPETSVQPNLEWHTDNTPLAK
ncbi:hypothetical protein [Salinadaptatus halalkaliphilus]|nr:hypothetical protein [Salinadaptatus halalkaliphilus]